MLLIENICACRLELAFFGLFVLWYLGVFVVGLGKQEFHPTYKNYLLLYILRGQHAFCTIFECDLACQWV